MQLELIDAPSTQERTRLYLSQKAKCYLYEPLSDSEGRCCASINQNMVSILGGCNSPETCSILNKNKYPKEIKW